jgi:hypothetical protein
VVEHLASKPHGEGSLHSQGSHSHSLAPAQQEPGGSCDLAGAAVPDKSTLAIFLSCKPPLMHLFGWPVIPQEHHSGPILFMMP